MGTPSARYGVGEIPPTLAAELPTSAEFGYSTRGSRSRAGHGERRLRAISLRAEREGTL